MTLKIRATLEALATEHDGILHPAVVVEAARAETSPLHASFIWDDSKAAHQWRLWQARQLITAVVRYEATETDGEMERRQVFVSLTTDRHEDGPGYRLLTNVLSDAAQRAQLLQDARADMLLFRQKYARLKELADVFAAMQLAEDSIVPNSRAADAHA